MKFSHLHNHTQYSLLDGASSIKNIYSKAIKDGMPAVAITDHGNMFGVFDFVVQAYKNKNEDGTLKVKPIIGCEFYVVEDRTIHQFTKEKKDVRYHQLFLAKNEQGYKNLVKLCSLGFIEGLYGKYPRIDKELILKYHEGLIATTCCLGASVPKTILKHGEEAGLKEFKWWLDLFGENYFVELQRHGIPEQETVNVFLTKWAKEYNVPIIASNDSHYLDVEDANTHDILLCVNTGAKQSDPTTKEFKEDEEQASVKSRFAFFNNQFFFKSTEQMIETFQDLPEAIDNTNMIVDMVEPLKIERDILLPHYQVPSEFKSMDAYLEFLTWEGAKRKYKIISPEAESRIQFELGVIKQMGFAGYFLIVSDFIRHAKDTGVFVGPGRGSAAGSVVAYLTDITNIDPIKYNLLFERFLNPDRASMPDIDTDFDDDGRQKVIEYVAQKYGKNQVAQIGTYGTMAAKSSIKDVARVLDLPLQQSNTLAKLVPDTPGTSLKHIMTSTIRGTADSLEKKDGLQEEDLKNIETLHAILKEGKSLEAHVLKEALKLEGTIRNTGIHAAGIIIAPSDLTELIPVFTSKGDPMLITQFEGSVIENAGVIKMDFLGLRNLTILKQALAMIKENHGIDIHLDELPLDDELTYELYQRGETNGTFQFESGGMQKHLKDLKPDKFDDLIAMNALYRPGPIKYIPNFIARKHGTEKIEYDVPEMEEYLSETYGITVYQEQVMLLSQKLANFTKGDADVLRKAMGKKQLAVLEKMYPKFVAGCEMNGHPKDKVDKIWKDWIDFAQYAFNKSHSTCYAYVAYHTAYLKAHYPSEYLAAVLNNSGDITRITFFMQECKRMGLTVLGPDVNESQKGFSVNMGGVIRFGLGAIKGVGDAAVEELIENRTKHGKFVDVFDMVKRLSSRTVSKKTLETLIMGGALDCFTDIHRGQYFHIAPGEMQSNLEKIIKFGQQVSSASNTMLNSLFGDAGMPEATQPKLSNCDEWTLTEKLEREKEMVGIYISAHPLDGFSFEMNNFGFMPLSEIENENLKGKTFKIAGYIANELHLVSKKGTKYGKFKVVDYHGEFEFQLFRDDYLKYASMLMQDNKVVISGTFAPRFYDPSLFEFKISHIMLLDNVLKIMTKRINIEIPIDKLNDELVHLISKHTELPGKCEVGIKVVDLQNQQIVKMFTSYKKIEMSEGFLDDLTKVEGIHYSVITM